MNEHVHVIQRNNSHNLPAAVDAAYSARSFNNWGSSGSSCADASARASLKHPADLQVAMTVSNVIQVLQFAMSMKSKCVCRET
jgi:hypothetical protein